MRAAPASVLRSALFGLVPRGQRRYIDGPVASWSGTAISYEGDALDQADLDVWLQAVHEARHDGNLFASRIELRPFLRALGRAEGKGNRDWLHSVFQRLQRGSVQISAGGGRQYQGSLVLEFSFDPEAEAYVLRLSPTLTALFASDYVRVPWDVRLSLATDLARWILGYVRSHRATPTAPHRIALDHLKELCGSRRADARQWANDVRMCFRQLEACGEVAAWKVERGVLSFARRGT